MRVMVLVKATPQSEADAFDADFMAATMAAMGRFNAELQAAGILVMADGLMASGHGKRVAFDGDSRRVSDGPFGPAHELVAGFWLWDVKDIDEAVAWVQRCPNPMPVASVIGIRQVQC